MIDRNRQAQEHSERGNAFDDAGDAPRAIDEWKLATQLNPNHFEAHYNLGIAYADVGDLVAAIPEMETAHAIELEDRDAQRELVGMLIERGDALIAQKDAARATQDWERALELDSENALVHFKLGKAYADSGKFSDAENYLREAIRCNHLFADAYDQLAEIFVTQNRTRDAIDLLRHALNTFHSMSEGARAASISLLGSAAEIESLPHDVTVSDLARDLADLELDQGDPDRAMAALELAEPDADDAEVWNEIAQAFDARGDLESAEIARSRAEEIEHGEWAESEPSKEQLLQNPAEASYARGEQLYELGNFDDAFEAYEQAVELNPNHAGAHYGMGVVYQQDEEYELAEQEYREALRSDPDHADAHFGLAEIFDAREDWQNAVKEYREVLRIDPNDKEARENLIWDLLETNAPSDAQAELLRGEFKAKSAAELWHGLGKAWEARNTRGSAIAAYRRAVELNPKLRDARDALKRLGG